MRGLKFWLCWLLWVGSAGAQTWQERSLAAVLMGEARGEGRAGLEAVAEVIVTRTRQTGHSVQQVITQAAAFSCLNGTNVDRLYARMRRERNWNLAVTVARTVYRCPDLLPSRVPGATHYDRVDRRPYWTHGAQLVAVVGRHAFWRLPG